MKEEQIIVDAFRKQRVVCNAGSLLYRRVSAPPDMTDHVYNIFKNANWVVGVAKHMHDGMLCRRLLKR